MRLLPSHISASRRVREVLPFSYAAYNHDERILHAGDCGVIRADIRASAAVDLLFAVFRAHVFGAARRLWQVVPL